MSDQLKSTFECGHAAPSPSSGAGSDGGPLNSQGSGGIIDPKTFFPVSTGGGSGQVEGSFKDKMEPKSVSTAPAGGAGRGNAQVESTFTIVFGKK